MTQITLNEFPEDLQILLNQAQKTGETLTITQNGIPLAVISPIKLSKKRRFGSMKDSGKIIGDIVEPTSDLVTWEVLQ
jgi:prevent-host-death family protein